MWTCRCDMAQGVPQSLTTGTGNHTLAWSLFSIFLEGGLFFSQKSAVGHLIINNTGVMEAHLYLSNDGQMEIKVQL